MTSTIAVHCRETSYTGEKIGGGVLEVCVCEC